MAEIKQVTKYKSVSEMVRKQSGFWFWVRWHWYRLTTKKTG